jgi:hypothetical protein
VHTYGSNREAKINAPLFKERLPALVHDLFTFSRKVYYSIKEHLNVKKEIKKKKKN